MQSSAATVKAYIDEQRAPWQPVLRKLRAGCRRELIGYTEGMAYGMPSYTRAGAVEVSFALQVQYLSLYILKQAVLDAQRDDLTGLSLGKGCVRFRRTDQVDWAVVTSLLSATRASDGEIC
jgi:uncharacterized protein YdhG (YjbR/CyaY superfamily)